MIDLLFRLLFNPSVLLVYAGAAAILALVWFGFGPVRFWAVIKDWKTWAAVVVAAFVVSYLAMDRKVEKLTDQVKTEQHHNDAKEDVVDVLENRARRADRQRANQTRQQEAIANADPGQELDALLDEIARQQGDSPDAGVQPGGVRERADGVVYP